LQEERPRFPPKLIKAEVINNPFPDIIPRVESVKGKPKEEVKKQKTKGTK
jgi:peptidyl-prolyl cis-trans isomerase SDCCAG10